MTLAHRYWEGDVDLRGAVAAATLEEFTLAEWTRPGLRRAGLVAALRLADAKAPLVPDVDRARHTANVVRLFVLQRFGGYWCDNDLYKLGPWDELPVPATAAHIGGHRCNAWMSFPAGHPALQVAIDAIVIADTPGRSPQVSGEDMLERVWGDEIARVEFRVDGGRSNVTAPLALRHDGRSNQ